MKALIELHFQHEANVLRSMLSYPNETSKECIQFLSDIVSINELSLILTIICQCDIKHIITLHIKTTFSVLKVSIHTVDNTTTTILLYLSTFLKLLKLKERVVDD